MAKKNNMLLIDLNDPKTKSVAETITSETSRKILDYLAGKEDASESEISEELKIAISTVHYHLQKLTEAGLVEIGGFTYSKKGREINRYSLANQYIIITPRKIDGLKSKLKKILPIAAIPLGLGGILKIIDIFYQSRILDTMVPLSDYSLETGAAKYAAAEEVAELDMADAESMESSSFETTIESDSSAIDTSAIDYQGFHFGLHELSIALMILSALIVLGYLVYQYFNKE